MDTVTVIFLGLVVFVPVFTLIVVVHEGGHYLAGRMCGIRAEAFSVGMGPVVLKWGRPGGTEWRLSALPIGGYVKYAGDTNASSVPNRAELDRLRAEYDAQHGDGAADGIFHFKPVWQRAFAIVAGPLANFILAIALLGVFAFAFGNSVRPPVVGTVIEGSAADIAGFLPGDVIVSVDGRDIAGFNEISSIVAVRSGDMLDVVVERDGATMVLQPTIERVDTGEVRMGRRVVIGRLGIWSDASLPAQTVRLGPFAALGEGVRSTWDVVALTGRFIGRLFQGRESVDNLTGILGMGQLASEGAKNAIEVGQEEGHSGVRISGNIVMWSLTLAAYLSISIGLVNLLPILPLDGGHLVVYAYEAVARRPMNETVLGWANYAGLALVLAFMLFVNLNDVRWAIAPAQPAG